MIYIRILKNNDFTKLYVIKHCFSRLYRILVLSYLKKHTCHIFIWDLPELRTTKNDIFSRKKKSAHRLYFCMSCLSQNMLTRF